MAKLEPNTIIGILHGTLADLVFVRRKDGSVYVRRRPVRKKGPSPDQVENQSRFKQALAYVTRQRLNPGEYSAYETAAKLRGKRPCDLANADFRYPPSITDIDLSGYTGRPGELIRVQAVDDFEVVQLFVTIADFDGTLLEHGAADLDQQSSRWQYVAETTAPHGKTVAVHVTASDRAGNVATKTVHHALRVSE